MCGIVGTIHFGGRSAQRGSAHLNAMRDAMRHRGPDGFGTWVAPHGRVALGHRRLSIIDLSASANQPMSNEDGSLRIVFNGEIYNHADIRAQLENIGGHCWKTDHSDTEVILHAFEQWGIECLNKFRGMFAFALWDEARRELWLVRDRIGIKPLYYSIHHGRLTFASEIKALLHDPDQDRAVNEEAFFHYLSTLTTPAPQTLFRGIRKLPGGSWLRVGEDGSIHEQRYWDVLDAVEPLPGCQEEEIADRILAELRIAVQLRKVSDVPVGVFLSGGVDSSVNAALFSEGQREPVQTFSIGYDSACKSYPSELPYARRMAAHVGAEHHERVLTEQDLLDFLPEMIRLQDEPIADPVCVPVYYVSKLARDSGVTVCQVGEGSDELFWGYRFWQYSLRLQQMARLPVPNIAKQLGLSALACAGKGESPAFEWLRRDVAGLPVFWGGAEGFTDSQKQRLLSPRLRRSLSGLSTWDALAPIRRCFEERAWEPSPLAWMTYLDLNLRLPELLLMRVDKMSMGVGLEARVPFLDHKLVELAMSIPQRVKTRRGKLKYILKKAVRDLIPTDVLHRRKQGFGIPLREWFSGELGVFAKEQLRTFCQRTDFFEAAEMERVLAGHDPRKTWYLLNFALWWNQYIDAPIRLPALAAV